MSLQNNPNQDLTELNKAFLKLCCSIGILNGKAPENITSGNFDMVTSDAHQVFNLANALFSQKLDAQRGLNEVASHE